MIKIHTTEQNNGAKCYASADMIVDGPLYSIIDCFARNRRHMTEQDNCVKSLASTDIIADGTLHSMIDCFARNRRHMIRS